MKFQGATLRATTATLCLASVLGATQARAESCPAQFELRPGDYLELYFQFSETPMTPQGPIDFFRIITGSSTNWNEGSSLVVALLDGGQVIHEEQSGQEISYEYRSADSLWTGGTIIDMSNFVAGTACGKHIRQPVFVDPDPSHWYFMGVPRIETGRAVGPGSFWNGPDAQIVDCHIVRVDDLFYAGFEGGPTGSCSP